MRCTLIGALIWMMAGFCHASFDVFMEMRPANAPSTPVPGDTTDAVYKNWIEVIGFDAGNSPLGGDELQAIGVVKTADSSTPILMDAVGRGRLFESIRLTVVSNTAQRVELWEIVARNAYVRELSLVGDASTLAEMFTIVMGQLEVIYTNVNVSGDPTSERFTEIDQVANTSSVVKERAPMWLGGVDSDGDGIPDGFESHYGLQTNAADAMVDSDGDGMNNFIEWVAHTNPVLPDVVFKITGLQGTMSQISMSWTGVIGLEYTVEGAPAPNGPWTFIKKVTAPVTGITTTQVVGSVGRSFFRVLTPPPPQ